MPGRGSFLEWRFDGHPMQAVHAEELFGVCPNLLGREAGLSGQSLEVGEIVFVGVLGVDRLALPKAEDLSGDPHLLIGTADQVHLDTAVHGIEACLVGEGLRIQIAVEFAVDPGQ